MVNLKATLTIFSLSLVLSSCGNYLERKSEGDDGNLKFSKEELDFSIVQSKIFSPRCVSCHQQYGSYAGVRRELASISSAVSANRMPKTGGPLSGPLKQLLLDWTDAGSPEVAGQIPVQEPVTIHPVWQSISDNIIAPRCLVCHNPNGQAKFLDLSTRQAIFSSRNRLFGEGEGKKLINFDQPDLSYLFDVINDDVEPMPPVWANIRRLNVEEIGALKEWIGLGLP